MSLLFVALLAAVPSISVEVIVPLCDSQLIACGRGAAGDPESLEGNLYWGAAFGAERFLSRASGYRVVKRVDSPVPEKPYVLRELEIVRLPRTNEREVRLRLLAYSGRFIDRALEDFLQAAAGSSGADVIVWVGHDRLMDVPAPKVSRTSSGKPVAVLACSSEQFFGPVLQQLGARPVLLTRTFMAPEAYLLEAFSGAIARHGPVSPGQTRDALVAAYARYQRIPVKAASTVFSRPSQAPKAEQAR